MCPLQLFDFVLLYLHVLFVYKHVIVFKIVSMNLLPLLITILIIVNDSRILLEWLLAANDAAALVEFGPMILHSGIVNVNVLQVLAQVADTQDTKLRLLKLSWHSKFLFLQCSELTDDGNSI